MSGTSRRQDTLHAVRRIGHRGAKGHAPENTIASFQTAIDIGCDEIETDVWLVEDRLLISHDRPHSTDHLLTLEQVLDFCRGKVALNLELKSAGSDARASETGAAVARLLRSRDPQDAYVSSFWYAALAGAKAVASDVPRAFVYGAAPDMMALLGQARALELWALHPERHYVTPERVTAADRADLKVNVWTVNDPNETAQRVDWGGDGIMSDYPERVPKS